MSTSTYIRKADRAANALNSGRFALAVQQAANNWKTREFDETPDGARIRVWGDQMVDRVTKEDVRSWLLNMRVVELADGLEFLREDYIKSMVRDGFLRKDTGSRGAFYWVTRAAADKWDLPRVMGCEFPK